MTFRTKLDYSNNRQIKQHIETLTLLSGATSFGVTFNDLPTGPNLSTSGETENYNFVASTFSGNNTTTIITWYDPRMALGEPQLSAITPITSAETQTVLPVFGPSAFTTIDGNTVATAYTGVTFDLSVITMTDLGGGNYVGTLESEIFDVLSASTLDFTGRTIWADVSGITRTERLIVTNNPQVGYVLTCSDTEGMAEWQPSGSSSGGSFDVFVTGGTYNSGSGVATFTNNTGGTFNVIGFTAGTGGTGSSYWSAGTGTNAITTLGSTNIASGNYAVAEGENTQALGLGSHAEGRFSIASGASSHAEGSGAEAIGAVSHAGGEGTLAANIRAYAIGYNTIASGDTSYAQGYLTQANGWISHAEGYFTQANSSFSHAEGINSITSGQGAHAEGSGTTAGGDASHAEGTSTIASGITSHAEGNLTIAYGDFSHAEGSGTTTYGESSHAEGNATIASGISSHAEGGYSQANGHFSHAEGWETRANGLYSHAGGYNTQANGAISFVFGTNSQANVINSIVLGANITGATADTTYVDNLNIKTVGAGPGTIDLGINGSGLVVNQASDARLKENVNTITNALDIVMNLRGVSYNWIDRVNGGDGIRLGFIAQEVQEVVPELVTNNGDYLGVQYKDVPALLVEAIKELINGESTHTINNTHIETQTILAEDNNIELNYNGTPTSAIGGGIVILNIDEDGSKAELLIDANGNWITNNGFEPKELTIPFFTPTSSNDETGKIGNITRNDDYLFVKTSQGWKRSNLESF